jgi:hypothetical protein
VTLVKFANSDARMVIRFAAIDTLRIDTAAIINDVQAKTCTLLMAHAQ